MAIGGGLARDVLHTAYKKLFIPPEDRNEIVNDLTKLRNLLRQSLAEIEKLQDMSKQERGVVHDRAWTQATLWEKYLKDWIAPEDYTTEDAISAINISINLIETKGLKKAKKLINAKKTKKGEKYNLNENIGKLAKPLQIGRKLE